MPVNLNYNLQKNDDVDALLNDKNDVQLIDLTSSLNEYCKNTEDDNVKKYLIKKIIEKTVNPEKKKEIKSIIKSKLDCKDFLEETVMEMAKALESKGASSSPSWEKAKDVITAQKVVKAFKNPTNEAFNAALNLTSESIKNAKEELEKVKQAMEKTNGQGSLMRNPQLKGGGGIPEEGEEEASEEGESSEEEAQEQKKKSVLSGFKEFGLSDEESITLMIDKNHENYHSKYKTGLMELDWSIKFNPRDASPSTINKKQFVDLISKSSIEIVDISHVGKDNVKLEEAILFREPSEFGYVVKLKLAHNSLIGDEINMIDFLKLHKDRLLILAGEGLNAEYGDISDLKNYLLPYGDGRIIMAETPTTRQIFTDMINLENKEMAALKLCEYDKETPIPTKKLGESELLKPDFGGFAGETEIDINPFNTINDPGHIYIVFEVMKDDNYVITIFGKDVNQSIKEQIESIIGEEKEKLINQKRLAELNKKATEMLNTSRSAGLTQLEGIAKQEYNNALFKLNREHLAFIRKNEAKRKQEQDKADLDRREAELEHKIFMQTYSTEKIAFEQEILQKTMTEETENLKNELKKQDELYVSNLEQLQKFKQDQINFILCQDRILREENEQFKTKEAVLKHIQGLIGKFQKLVAEGKTEFQQNIVSLQQLSKNIEDKFKSAQQELEGIKSSIEQDKSKIDKDIQTMNTTTTDTAKMITSLKTTIKTTTGNYQDLIKSSTKYYDSLKRKINESQSFTSKISQLAQSNDLNAMSEYLDNLSAGKELNTVLNSEKPISELATAAEAEAAEAAAAKAATKGGARKGKSMKHTKKSSKKTKKRTASSKKTKRKKSKSGTKSTKHTKRKK